MNPHTNFPIATSCVSNNGKVSVRVKTLDFETAAILRDEIASLETLIEKA